jgi:hypothetical protein
MYNMVLYLCVLIVFSLHRESLKLILAMDPLRVVLSQYTEQDVPIAQCFPLFQFERCLKVSIEVFVSRLVPLESYMQHPIMF